jgi:YVTN family beta-propeller protein
MTRLLSFAIVVIVLFPFLRAYSQEAQAYTMPYNRIVDAAGQTVRFGDKRLENHSLDATILPGSAGNTTVDGQTSSGAAVLAVEDRYGIVLFNTADHRQLARYAFTDDAKYRSLMSTYSGIKAISFQGSIHIFWGAAAANRPDAYVMEAKWDGNNLALEQAIPIAPLAPATNALPNEVAPRIENGELMLYAVLNGNNQLIKLKVAGQSPVWTSATGVAPFGLTIVGDRAWVTNWAGPVPDLSKETAGVPWGSAYIDPRTGATAAGSVSVIDLSTGKQIIEIPVGLHPNAIIHSPDGEFVYVSNGNSDNISVINVARLRLIDSIPVSPFEKSDHYAGSTPNAIAIDSTGTRLYVANGLNNAIAVIRLAGSSQPPSHHATGQHTHSATANSATLLGFIPTEAYPSGIICRGSMLYVTNLEAIGSRVKQKDSYNSHWEEASLTFIPIPDQAQLDKYTQKTKTLNLAMQEALSRSLPRQGVVPKPLPERIGEPSLFRHVVYIIKENRTYDQVLGDMPQGEGMPSLCTFGDSVTPNEHRLAKDFILLDHYFVSGKSSAEGHQWTDASMVTDYVERMVRAWFRSYPHAQYDAMVYDKEGFIWNNALDHGKTVRIYGEACRTDLEKGLDWTTIFQYHKQRLPFDARNFTTISRVRPILSAAYPGYDDPRITDQLRADAFIKELNDFSKMPGDQLPQLMILSLPDDHTTGMTPGFPTPRAMVADNDLALARIIEAITKSRFWGSTAVFVTEDDSQSGWDHLSAYRTTGFVISPYSRLQRTVSTTYNQTSLVRTIEQILGLPPMNAIDATATPMFDCFGAVADSAYTYSPLPNLIPLDEMNRALSQLKGRDLHFARLSMENKMDEIDEGDDDVFNRILWWAAKGRQSYPKVPR